MDTTCGKLRCTERAYYDGMRVPHGILQQVPECAGLEMAWTQPGWGMGMHPAA